MKFNITSIENRIKSFLIDAKKRINITHKLIHNGRTFRFSDNIALNAWQKEPDTLKWIETMGKDDVVFDIGANVGVYTMIMSKFAKKVFSFEPSVFGFQTLTNNMYANDLFDNVTILNMGLSDVDDIEVVKYPSFCKIGSGSWGVTASRPDSAVKFKHNVIVCRVDTLVERFGVPKPTHIKLDVDGAELNILKGSEQTIKSDSFKSLLVELDERDEESPAYLKSLGLKYKERYSVGSKNPENRRYNYLFEKSG